MIRNLTPHVINIQTLNGEILEIPPEPISARTEIYDECVGEIRGIPVYQTFSGKTINLPEPMEGVIYIVSYVVLQANQDRDDLFCPSQKVKDSTGKVLYCKGLLM